MSLILVTTHKNNPYCHLVSDVVVLLYFATVESSEYSVCACFACLFKAFSPIMGYVETVDDCGRMVHHERHLWYVGPSRLLDLCLQSNLAMHCDLPQACSLHSFLTSARLDR